MMLWSGLMADLEKTARRSIGIVRLVVVHGSRGFVPGTSEGQMRDGRVGLHHLMPQALRLESLNQDSSNARSNLIMVWQI